jgi:hypothetical protein
LERRVPEKPIFHDSNNPVLQFVAVTLDGKNQENQTEGKQDSFGPGRALASLLPPDAQDPIV